MNTGAVVAEPPWWEQARNALRRWVVALCPNALWSQTMDPTRIERLLRVGQARWPAIAVEALGFEQYLRSRDLDSEDHIADLFLAWACAQGDKSALSAFESEYLSQVPNYIAKIERDPVFVEEVSQLLRSRLLVASPPALPRIADYAGSGPLGGWLRVVAVRAALELKKAVRKDVDADEDSSQRMMASPDPELQYVRVRYAGEFRKAFAQSLGDLETRQRTILKLYLVDGLNIERIGKLYEVHRATVARWIQTARDSLYDGTKSRLQQELKVTPAEFESLLGVVRSDLDLSVCRLLGETPSDSTQ